MDLAPGTAVAPATALDAVVAPGLVLLARLLAGAAGVSIIVGAALLPATVRAQDFSAPAPAGSPAGPLAAIERGLADTSAWLRIEATTARWFGLPDLTTRALAAGGGWRAVRGALGISQTGDPELGWSAVGLALGAAQREGGAALRAVARRDRRLGPAPGSWRGAQGGVGIEVGGGAWVEAGADFRLWASAPQVWARGESPPLDRPLEIGVSYRARDATLWLSRGAPAGDAAADHEAGLMLRSGPLALWAVARDRPLRGGIGVAAHSRGLVALAAVESHPALGETVRLGLGLGGAP
ncbi:MAG: hypothetical protein HZC42_11320 [Candidatus Eisenbacteria bacterium]|nr:hypothetical protein [Candidatus Eisenbacteria bacterium]